MYIGFGLVFLVGIIGGLYYKYQDILTRTMIGIRLELLGVSFAILHLLIRALIDIDKMNKEQAAAIEALKKEQEEKITLVDATAQNTYEEVLSLHEKNNGMFSFMRKGFDRRRTGGWTTGEVGIHTDEKPKIISIYFLPNAGGPLIEQITFFHDWIILFMVGIAIFTLSTLFTSYLSSFTHRKLLDNQSVEYIWTLFPGCVLFAIGLPSLNLLYLFDEQGTPSTTVKALGHQWYWKYDYPDIPSYDSYLINANPYRLLDSDNRLFLPLLQPVQILITAADVLHSWTLPALAVKADAVPGRVNKLTLQLNRTGVFFGQCREICGRNHRFIPIAAECHF